MNPSNEVTERAAFEAAFADKLDFLRLSPDAEYFYSETGYAWDGWQARASIPPASAEPTLYDAVAKLIKAKGRFHTEQNYAALVRAFDATKPAPAPEMQASHGAVNHELLLAKYIEHVGASEGITFIERLSKNGSGEWEGMSERVTFSQLEKEELDWAASYLPYIMANADSAAALADEKIDEKGPKNG